VNDLRKYHIRIDRAQSDNLYVGLPQFRDGHSTVNTCAVVYERDGELDVMVTVWKESVCDGDTVELLPSQKFFPEALAHLSEEKQAQLLDILDRFPEYFSDTPGYTEEAKHAIPLLPTFAPKRMNA